jgi:hypothetical protein
MPEVNPITVIADCIEKSKATADQELIADYITEALWEKDRGFESRFLLQGVLCEPCSSHRGA